VATATANLHPITYLLSSQPCVRLATCAGSYFEIPGY
jgi:hypothetical protein